MNLKLWEIVGMTAATGFGAGTIALHSPLLGLACAVPALIAGLIVWAIP